MKRYYFAVIPIAITIIAVYYMAMPHETKSNELTPQMMIQNGSPMLGDSNAKVTIVEFGDYQCTYCHLFHENTKNALLQQYVDTGKVNFVFRDFPLNGPDSVLAAEAAYCAGDQDKYWQYHDELYKNWAGEKTGWVNQKSLDKFATTVGLEMDKFDKCISDNKYEQKVLDNQKFGENIGIDGTPSFIIFSGKNITKVVGAQPLSVFQQVIDKFQNS
ncbi:MAG TPA: thioredoxin domain-containing protein [Candidatus Nitrosotalea sp.]|nr:thioredoxin domain-containing protein [Candidatus Nitrosotalea sp.]